VTSCSLILLRSAPPVVPYRTHRMTKTEDVFIGLYAIWVVQTEIYKDDSPGSFRIPPSNGSALLDLEDLLIFVSLMKLAEGEWRNARGDVKM